MSVRFGTLCDIRQTMPTKLFILAIALLTIQKEATND
jgi:hypothetical protein